MGELLLPINQTFAKMLDDTSQCYKFYWLEAITHLILSDDREYSFDEIIDEMIVNAWYTVTMYHLHLETYQNKQKVQSSWLEVIINKITENSVIEPGASREDIIKAIKENNKIIKDDKDALAVYVPYRLLSSFIPEMKGESLVWKNTTNFINYIKEKNKEVPLFYTINPGKGLQKSISINPYWREYVLTNYPIVIGWIKYKKITYIQARNPGVPGIANKLDLFVGKRDLEDVKKLWKYVSKKYKITDVYTGNEIDFGKTHIDHFIPWSYVSCDELWNLIPVDGAVNESKSNSLPSWDDYFPRFATNQYFLYRAIYDSEQGMKLFNQCKRANLFSLWANELLYVDGKTEEEFKSTLENNMKPVYMSAFIQGYEIWKYEQDGQLL